MSGSSEELKKPKRAVRQRARRTSSASKERVTRTATKRRTTKSRASATTARTTPKAKKIEATPEVSQGSETRKAPTPLADTKKARARRRNRNIITSVLVVIGVVSSAAVGYTDDGRINVNATIEARNERIRQNQLSNPDAPRETIVIPVQNSGPRELNDGRVGRGKPDPVTPPPSNSVSTTTATTTDSGTATSTESGVATTTEVVADEESLETITDDDAVDESNSVTEEVVGE
jgi:hypothetical protein